MYINNASATFPNILISILLHLQVDCMIPDLYNNCCWTMYTTVFADV